VQPDDLIRRRPAQVAAVALLAAVAAVPFLGAVDARLDTMLDASRTCPGEALATLVSDLVGPVGVAVLAVVVLRSVWNGRPAPAEIVRILATLGAGVILVGELKEFLDRPRPGAEFAGPTGASFPSGHVGNTVLLGIAVLALWYGGAPRPVGRRGWLLLAIIATAIAAARVYGRRHWPSDVVGSAALALGYGLVAMLHPDLRWRTGVGVAALVGIGLVHAAYRHGITVAIPAGTAASRRLPLEQIDFGSAYQGGLLRGTWSLDESNPQRRAAWLRAPTGELALGRVDPAASELRLVLRPRLDGETGVASCRRLRVTLNDRVLGERLLEVGWRSYVFFTDASDFRPDGNVLTFQVRREPSESDGAGERRAAFRELALHAAVPGADEQARPALSGPAPGEGHEQHLEE
jgi:membrane-associated phospholipid phosphatase